MSLNFFLTVIVGDKKVSWIIQVGCLLPNLSSSKHLNFDAPDHYKDT